MEKDQSEKARHQSNSADRSTNIDAFMIAFVFVLWFTVVGMSHSFLQIRDGKRRKMSNDQQAHHDGNREHPKHAEIAHSKPAEYGSAQECHSIGSANESIGLISLILGHQNGHKCRESNRA